MARDDLNDLRWWDVETLKYLYACFTSIMVSNAFDDPNTSC